MDIRAYRLLRQQQRENAAAAQSNAPSLPPLPPSSSHPSAYQQAPSDSAPRPSHPPRRPSRFKKLVQGRKSSARQTYHNYEDEIEMKSLMPTEHPTSQEKDPFDDYTHELSNPDNSIPNVYTSPSKTPPASPSSLPLQILKNFTKAPIRFQLRPSTILFSALVFLIFLLIAYRKSIYVYALRRMDIPPGVYARDAKLYVGKNTRFFIKGLSWFGMELPEHTPLGLDKLTVNQVFDFVEQHRFNAIRIPLSIQNLKANPLTGNKFSTFLNPELVPLHYKDVIRAIVRKAAERHILVLLDVHRLHNDDEKPLGYWFKHGSPETELENIWVTLATEFGDEWNILGADLFNEPWNVTWNDKPDDPTNWKRMAESLTNTIHRICPSWLVFIEGVGDRAGKCRGCFWSENLNVIKDLPPKVDRMNKIVLSPHVYGPSVFMHDYFESNNFSKGMPALWDSHFGQCDKVTGIPTVIGEWGGTFEGKDGEWQREMFQYIMRKELSFFYWCLNPESSDTGGLLKENWLTPEQEKLSLIAPAPSTSVKQHKEHFLRFRSF